jgi:hypothetical protein
MNPRIFYFAYDHQRPMGGQKSVYRHVDILQAAGFESYVLHFKHGFRLTWFDNDTPVVDGGQFKSRFDPARDFIVLPEDLGKNILSFPGSKKIINNQSVAYGFLCFGLENVAQYPYLSADVRGIIVKSHNSIERLQFAYPGKKIYRLFAGIDSDKYRFRPLGQKRRLIVAPPDKNQIDLAQVFHTARSRACQNLNPLAEYDWVFIKNMKEAEVCALLQDALALVFLSTFEGFGRLPLEAILCGALVIAYEVPPLTEFLSHTGSFLTPPGDICRVVAALEKVAAACEQDPGRLELMQREAMAGAEYFSLARETESVVDTWRQIIQNN